MALKPPERPEDIYPELLADLKAALGEDLQGLCVYGSAAQGRYKKGSSDINLMVLMSEQSHHRLKDLIPFCRKWASARVAAPLLLTPEYVATSQDVFPIEFLVMAPGRRCLFGRDPLEGLNPTRAHLRLQLERELKAKLLALRTRLLTSEGQDKALQALLMEALPAFTALFQAWLHLTTGDFPPEPGQVLDKVGAGGITIEAFRALSQARAGRGMPKAQELWAWWERALHELEAFIRRVDALDVEQGA